MLRKLNIGGTEPSTGWEIFNIQPGEHVDHVGDAQDLSRFADETFDEIYASHVLEHFGYEGPLQSALKQWHRVLKNNGKLYISVPNMEILCKLFLKKGNTPDERCQIMRMMFGGHLDQNDYHYAGLYPEILYHYLSEAGFKKLKPVESLGIFEDTSTFRIGETPISLNLLVLK